MPNSGVSIFISIFSSIPEIIVKFLLNYSNYVLIF